MGKISGMEEKEVEESEKKLSLAVIFGLVRDTR
jgi:hypothetical protein